MAEREGFEPSVPGTDTHAFQACSLSHSDTSPDELIWDELVDVAEREGFEPPVDCSTLVFETSPFSRSGTSPGDGQCKHWPRYDLDIAVVGL